MAFKFGVSNLTSTQATLQCYKHDGTFVADGTALTIMYFMGE